MRTRYRLTVVGTILSVDRNNLNEGIDPRIENLRDLFDLLIEANKEASCKRKDSYLQSTYYNHIGKVLGKSQSW